jgi:hypothetical protein
VEGLWWQVEGWASGRSGKLAGGFGVLVKLIGFCLGIVKALTFGEVLRAVLGYWTFR